MNIFPLYFHLHNSKLITVEIFKILNIDYGVIKYIPLIIAIRYFT